MRDKDQAAAAISKDLAQDFEQQGDLWRRERRGRFVEDHDARAGKQHPRQFDELLHADRKVAEPGLWINQESPRSLSCSAAPGAPFRSTRQCLDRWLAESQETHSRRR